MRADISSCFEVQGCISSMSQGSDGDIHLVSTLMNGAHIFHLGEAQHPQNGSGRTITHVESFPQSTLGENPITTACFVSYDTCFATGCSQGGVTVVSRQSRSVVKRYTVEDKAVVLSLKEVPGEPSLLLSCSSSSAQVTDLETCTTRMQLHVPKPRVVGAVALTSNTIAVANYDGKVMLYDTRQGHEPVVLLAVPDQITSITSSPDTGAVAAGTVSGRVFVLRCLEGNTREEAFATGEERAPIRCIAMRNGYIAAGDTSAKVTLIDSRDNPNATRYWGLHTPLASDTVSLPQTAECTVNANATDAGTRSLSALTLQETDLWAAVSSTKYGISQVMVLPV